MSDGDTTHTIRGRLAPTPSGFLHLGNAFNFLMTWLLVRRTNGQLLLRVDDIDQGRMRPAYVREIFDLIDWLGLDYDEGPEGPDALEQQWSQRHRRPQYLDAYEKLIAGGEVFACQCTRAQLVEGRYPGTCKALGLAFQAGRASRIRTTGAHSDWEDALIGKTSHSPDVEMPSFVVWKKDDMPSYQLASVVDDISFSINLVVRGADLIQSTAAQLFLAERLAYHEFAGMTWYHHPLIEQNGQKLSKSAGAGAVPLREVFTSPTDIVRQFCNWTGLEEVGTTEELLALARERSGDDPLDLFK